MEDFEPNYLINGSTNKMEEQYELCDSYVRTTTRVRKALFPEILVDEESGENSHESSSIVELFAHPSQALKNCILELLSVKDQQQTSDNIDIAQLISSMNATDPEIVAQAIREVYLLSREDKFILHIASNEQLVGALIKASRIDNDQIKSNVAASLCHISQQGKPACYRIFKTGGIAELVQMLRSRIIPIVHYAVTTLHNLLRYTEAAKEETIACGGMEAFTPLLSARDEKLRALVADSIYLLLYERNQCKSIFLSLHGPQYLLDILNSSNYSKLVHAAVRCIRTISICPQNKEAFVAIGGFESLYKVLHLIEDEKIVLAILYSMRNLSDAATNLETLAPVVNYLLVRINDQIDEETVSCCSGILSNLTCNNTTNKQTICANNGIQILARCLTRFANIEDITEPTLCTLRHCTIRHPLAFQAQNEVRFAHQAILTLLATRRPPIVKAALGLVRNCAISQGNLESLISKSTPDGDTVVTIGIEVLESSGSEFQHDFNGLIEGVSLIEMVEGAISALHQLAKNNASAQYIYARPKTMKMLFDLMGCEQVYQNEDELMMREIMGLLYQLTKTSEGANRITDFGFKCYINAALNSPHKSIAAYAKIILRNMGIGNHNGNLANGHRPGSQDYANHDIGMHHDMGLGWINDGMELELYNELTSELRNFSPNLTDPKNASFQRSDFYDTDL